MTWGLFLRSKASISKTPSNNANISGEIDRAALDVDFDRVVGRFVAVDLLDGALWNPLMCCVSDVLSYSVDGTSYKAPMFTSSPMALSASVASVDLPFPFTLHRLTYRLPNRAIRSIALSPIWFTEILEPHSPSSQRHTNSTNAMPESCRPSLLAETLSARESPWTTLGKITTLSTGISSLAMNSQACCKNLYSLNSLSQYRLPRT